MVFARRCSIRPSSCGVVAGILGDVRRTAVEHGRVTSTNEKVVPYSLLNEVILVAENAGGQGFEQPSRSRLRL